MSLSKDVRSVFTVSQVVRRLGNAVTQVDNEGFGPVTLEEVEFALLTLLRWVKKLKKQGKVLYEPPPE
jgi:hypothetical protein